jgi:hypothetical protein
MGALTTRDGGGVEMKERRYLVVSSDLHAGPSLQRDLRPYCPARYLPDFDEYARHVRENAGHLHEITLAIQRDPHLREAFERTASCPGQTDPSARLRDMDDAGIAAEAIFAGGQNGEVLPFVGVGWDAGTRESRRGCVPLVTTSGTNGWPSSYRPHRSGCLASCRCRSGMSTPPCARSSGAAAPAYDW